MKNVFFAFVAFLCLVSCSKKNGVSEVGENDLFTLEYGNFEDELNLFDIAESGSVDTHIFMRDGFFFIANGESRKIIELNSYGDLLSLYYNADYARNLDFAQENEGNSTRKAISYPFNKLGSISVGGSKSLYVVDELPEERHEFDSEKRLHLSNVVLRFDLNGNFVDYIGQQGPGGTPFPFVQNIYATKNEELVVVCKTNEGLNVYWFAQNGFLLYDIPINRSTVPNFEEDENYSHFSIESAIPDVSKHKLYLKVDYYEDSVDSDLKVATGIDYAKTVLFPLNVESGQYDDGLEIPGYELSFSDDELSRNWTEIPFDFFGVTESGWFFFIVPTESGYLVQMVREDGQSIVKRALAVDHSKILYHSISLSDTGIISGLFARRENALISWWRTDSLLSSFAAE